MTETDLDQLAINTIRLLAADAVQNANSGHPGTPMGAAPAAYTLWQNFLRYDPAAPDWMNRDRFVLSVGHASMLLYALIHLTGIRGSAEIYGQAGRAAVTMEDIKNFGNNILDSVIASSDVFGPWRSMRMAGCARGKRLKFLARRLLIIQQNKQS